MIKKFDTMFPRCLYVAKNTTYEEIIEKFKIYFPNTETEIKYDKELFNTNTFDSHLTATVYLVAERDTENVGYIVIINEEKVDYGVCTHEATHICKRMEDYFGLESDANEYRAYVTEWYSNKIAEVWNNNLKE